MTEQFKFTSAEIEQINKLDHYSGTETNDRLFPLIEQVLAPRWAREVERVRELEEALRRASKELGASFYFAHSSLRHQIDAALKGR